MFPLPRKIIGGYVYGQKTTYNNFHTGTDYKANYEQLIAFADCLITSTGINNKSAPGGLWINMENDEVLVKTAHNSKLLVPKNTFVSAGTIIGITGNSGYQTTNPHCHLEIYDKKKQRFNPEKYHWYLKSLRDEKSMLIRQSEQGQPLYGEISYIDPTGVKHGFPTPDSYKNYASGGEAVEVIYSYYSKFPKGKDFPA